MTLLLKIHCRKFKMTAELFFQEFKKLILTNPIRPSQVLNSENCEYGNYIYYCKNLYNCFDCGQSSDGTYLFDTHSCANSADCDFCFESELCYESVDAVNCFNGNYLSNCKNVSDSSYSSDCVNCHDIFGCVRLNNKSFCIFNRQFTETDYREKVKYLKTMPEEKILAIVSDIMKLQPYTQTHEENNENSPFGNYIYYNKNCYLCFDASRNEDSGYLYDSASNKSSYNITQSSRCELSDEVIDSGDIFNSDHVVFSKNCADSSYIIDCLDVRNSLGCVKLEHQQYCILNRQLTKDEYERISKPLLAEIRQKNLGWENVAY